MSDASTSASRAGSRMPKSTGVVVLGRGCRVANDHRGPMHPEPRWYEAARRRSRPGGISIVRTTLPYPWYSDEFDDQTVKSASWPGKMRWAAPGSRPRGRAEAPRRVARHRARLGATTRTIPPAPSAISHGLRGPAASFVARAGSPDTRRRTRQGRRSPSTPHPRAARQDPPRSGRLEVDEVPRRLALERDPRRPR